jgi:hypothetical protein
MGAKVFKTLDEAAEAGRLTIDRLEASHRLSSMTASVGGLVPASLHGDDHAIGIGRQPLGEHIAAATPNTTTSGVEGPAR